MKNYLLDEEQVLKQLKSKKNGLSQSEAEKRLKMDGPNILKEENKELAIIKFFNEFNDEFVD